MGILKDSTLPKLLAKDDAQQLFADVSCAVEAGRVAVVTALFDAG